ncbi:phosphatidylglycerol:prolipoprotein diacylglycerol transferase [Ruminococcaceae bacterium YRB3002]|nr:phosphatidylglycerol:prolipoprotein diacylglycerol transferase [Ruminococcaceae bacterium YRB3002]
MNYDKISFPGLGIELDINPVAFSIGSLNVYWYGIIIAAGMLLCFFLAVKQARKNNFSPDLVYDLMFVTIPCAIVGARIYYVAFKWDYYSKDLTKIFDTRSGGLAVYGGVIAVLLGYFIMCRIRKIPYSTVLDYLAPLLPLGQAIGRWGNFFNQEAFGTTTNLPWGMTSFEISSYISANCPTLDPSMPVHPTFLYESLGNIILFVFLLYMRKNSKFAYETAACYFIGYGVIRFFVEGLRTDSLYITGTAIRASQLLSAILVFLGLLYIAYAHYKKIPRAPLPERFLISKEASESPESQPESADAEPETVEDVEEAAEDTVESEEPEAAEDTEATESSEAPSESDTKDNGDT